MLLSEAKTQSELTKMIEQRCSGVPLEQILGWAEFCGLRVSIEPGVFVPRFKTEFLVEHAITLCNPDSVVLDLCCGSGAIGLAIISKLPSVHLYSTDIDPISVTCARGNLTPFEVEVFQGDLFEPIPNALKGKIDILVANAPYVPTEAIEVMPREARLYETLASLDGGNDGLEVHRRIAMAAPEWLSSGGRLIIEIGENQAPSASKLFSENGLTSKVVYSEEFEATAVIGTKMPLNSKPR